MINTKYWTPSILASIAVGLQLLTGGTLPTSAAEFVPPDNVGAPRGRVGGGTRGGSPFDQVSPGVPGRRIGGGSRGCSVTGDRPTDQALTALVPETTMGLTVEAYPTFFWYLPSTSATGVEFVLMDEKGEKVIYETTFRTKGEAGIVSLNLPENASLPPLEINANYRWYFSIICNPEDRAADVYVQGWIRRIEASAGLTEQLLATTSDLERAEVYARNGIWHEAISVLAKLRRSNPNNGDIAREWEELITSVQLANVAQVPLVQEIIMEVEEDQQSRATEPNPETNR
ncbi:DUF928 domain-containing protein [Laspinema olomoucense]|uniref:DUF928 domain-containing protein n=1 Tax=Laspinema olomoucense TaxID=3231600 RepID=UPI0021BAAE9C|nr:DUF928 domain-containing protein [Laspinema sp. D3a]MCT7990094.1 DUF928 domain-containing protein [Laspinema sp. D3a]